MSVHAGSGSQVFWVDEFGNYHEYEFEPISINWNAPTKSARDCLIDLRDQILKDSNPNYSKEMTTTTKTITTKTLQGVGLEIHLDGTFRILGLTDDKYQPLVVKVTGKAQLAVLLKLLVEEVVQIK